MSYDMTKFNYPKWNEVEEIINNNKNKLIFRRKKFIKDLYYRQMNKSIDINNPKTFSEKLNVNKIDKRKIKEYYKYADKNLVRDYVKDKIGEKYLIEQYFSKSKITEEDLINLPNSFALKTNNGSGTNYIVKDKNKENLTEICNYLNKLVKIKYGYIWGELLYNKIKPEIVAEKLILDKNGNIPDDLKCFCFIDNDGIKRKILYIERVIDDERYRILFDEDWNPIDCKLSFEKLDFKIEKPDNYKEILYVIDRLSEDFNFVRVDLYILDKEIYFGELTFIPTAGFLKFEDENIDLLWGSYIGNNLK